MNRRDFIGGTAAAVAVPGTAVADDQMIRWGERLIHRLEIPFEVIWQEIACLPDDISAKQRYALFVMFDRMRSAAIGCKPMFKGESLAEALHYLNQQPE